ncbi:hypothetical protein V7S43_007310 [Phytophthora oleae]|uniref:Uncharacterized protein n=1 Tax=Phytophthora oleae TaxID=2107226 RepID=A0ABD3FLH1_9STRA
MERQARIAAEGTSDAALRDCTAAEADRGCLLAKRRAAQVQLNSLSSSLSPQAPAQSQRPSTAPDPHHATPVQQDQAQRGRSHSPSCRLPAHSQPQRGRSVPAGVRVPPAHGKKCGRSPTGPPLKRQRGPPVVEPDDDKEDDTVLAALTASRAAVRRKSSTGGTLEDPITLDDDDLDGDQNPLDQDEDRGDEHGPGDQKPPDQDGGRGGPGPGGFSPDGNDSSSSSGSSDGSSERRVHAQ